MPGGWTANYFVTVSTKALSLNGDALKSIVKRSATFVEQKGSGVGMASCSRCFSRISFICNVCWCRLHPNCPINMFSSPVVPPRESALSCAAWNLSRSKKIWKVSWSSQISHWATGDVPFLKIQVRARLMPIRNRWHAPFLWDVPHVLHTSNNRSGLCLTA